MSSARSIPLNNGDGKTIGPNQTDKRELKGSSSSNKTYKKSSSSSSNTLRPAISTSNSRLNQIYSVLNSSAKRLNSFSESPKRKKQKSGITSSSVTGSPTRHKSTSINNNVNTIGPNSTLLKSHAPRSNITLPQFKPTIAETVERTKPTQTSITNPISLITPKRSTAPNSTVNARLFYAQQSHARQLHPSPKSHQPLPAVASISDNGALSSPNFNNTTAKSNKSPKRALYEDLLTVRRNAILKSKADTQKAISTSISTPGSTVSTPSTKKDVSTQSISSANKESVSVESVSATSDGIVITGTPEKQSTAKIVIVDSRDDIEVAKPQVFTSQVDDSIVSVSSASSNSEVPSHSSAAEVSSNLDERHSPSSVEGETVIISQSQSQSESQPQSNSKPSLSLISKTLSVASSLEQLVVTQSQVAPKSASPSPSKVVNDLSPRKTPKLILHNTKLIKRSNVSSPTRINDKNGTRANEHIEKVPENNISASLDDGGLLSSPISKTNEPSAVVETQTLTQNDAQMLQSAKQVQSGTPDHSHRSPQKEKDLFSTPDQNLKKQVLFSSDHKSPLHSSPTKGSRNPKTILRITRPDNDPKVTVIDESLMLDSSWEPGYLLTPEKNHEDTQLAIKYCIMALSTPEFTKRYEVYATLNYIIKNNDFNYIFGSFNDNLDQLLDAIIRDTDNILSTVIESEDPLEKRVANQSLNVATFILSHVAADSKTPENNVFSVSNVHGTNIIRLASSILWIPSISKNLATACILLFKNQQLNLVTMKYDNKLLLQVVHSCLQIRDFRSATLTNEILELFLSFLIKYEYNLIPITEVWMSYVFLTLLNYDLHSYEKILRTVSLILEKTCELNADRYSIAGEKVGELLVTSKVNPDRAIKGDSTPDDPLLVTLTKMFKRTNVDSRDEKISMYIIDIWRNINRLTYSFSNHISTKADLKMFRDWTEVCSLSIMAAPRLKNVIENAANSWKILALCYNKRFSALPFTDVIYSEFISVILFRGKHYRTPWESMELNAIERALAALLGLLATIEDKNHARRIFSYAFHPPFFYRSCLFEYLVEYMTIGTVVEHPDKRAVTELATKNYDIASLKEYIIPDFNILFPDMAETLVSSLGYPYFMSDNILTTKKLSAILVLCEYFQRYPLDKDKVDNIILDKIIPISFESHHGPIDPYFLTADQFLSFVYELSKKISLYDMLYRPNFPSNIFIEYFASLCDLKRELLPLHQLTNPTLTDVDQLCSGNVMKVVLFLKKEYATNFLLFCAKLTIKRGFLVHTLARLLVDQSQDMPLIMAMHPDEWKLVFSSHFDIHILKELLVNKICGAELSLPTFNLFITDRISRETGLDILNYVLHRLPTISRQRQTFSSIVSTLFKMISSNSANGDLKDAEILFILADFAGDILQDVNKAPKYPNAEPFFILLDAMITLSKSTSDYNARLRRVYRMLLSKCNIGTLTRKLATSSIGTIFLADAVDIALSNDKEEQLSLFLKKPKVKEYMTLSGIKPRSESSSRADPVGSIADTQVIDDSLDNEATAALESSAPYSTSHEVPSGEKAHSDHNSKDNESMNDSLENGTISSAGSSGSKSASSEIPLVENTVDETREFELIDDSSDSEEPTGANKSGSKSKNAGALLVDNAADEFKDSESIDDSSLQADAQVIESDSLSASGSGSVPKASEQLEIFSSGGMSQEDAYKSLVVSLCTFDRFPLNNVEDRILKELQIHLRSTLRKLTTEQDRRKRVQARD